MMGIWFGKIKRIRACRWARCGQTSPSSGVYRQSLESDNAADCVGCDARPTCPWQRRNQPSAPRKNPKCRRQSVVTGYCLRRGTESSLLWCICNARTPQNTLHRRGEKRSATLVRSAVAGCLRSPEDQLVHCESKRAEWHSLVRRSPQLLHGPAPVP
jgi:hypothetical protein